MGIKPLSGKGQPRLWAVSLAARGKIVIGIPTCLNYCEIFIVCTEFTNVAAGRIIQTGGPRFGHLDMELRVRFKTDATCCFAAVCRRELFHKRVESLSSLNSCPYFFYSVVSHRRQGESTGNG